jgi:hypothetical protein
MKDNAADLPSVSFSISLVVPSKRGAENPARNRGAERRDGGEGGRKLGEL